MECRIRCCQGRATFNTLQERASQFKEALGVLDYSVNVETASLHERFHLILGLKLQEHCDNILAELHTNKSKVCQQYLSQLILLQRNHIFLSQWISRTQETLRAISKIQICPFRRRKKLSVIPFAFGYFKYRQVVPLVASESRIHMEHPCVAFLHGIKLPTQMCTLTGLVSTSIPEQKRKVCRIMKMFRPIHETSLSHASYPYDFAQHPDSGDFFVTDFAKHHLLIVSSDYQATKVFGEKGSSPGQFLNPTGVAFSPRGILAVVDHGNHRVQLFDTHLACIHAFGSFGNGPNMFIHPSLVAYDRLGHLYVTDIHTKTIQKFDGDGNFKEIIHQKHIRSAAEKPVYSITFNSKTEFYAWCLDSNSIQVYNLSGALVKDISLAFDVPGGSLITLTCGPMDTVFLSDNQNHVWHCTSTGALIGKHPFLGPSKALVSGLDKLYTLCSNTKSLIFGNWTWNAEKQSTHDQFLGRPKKVVGGNGCSQGQLKRPSCLCIHPKTGDVYVTNTGNHRIDVFSPDLAFKASFSCSKGKCSALYHPFGIFISPDGQTIGVTDYGNHCVKLFDESFNLRRVIGSKGADAGQFERPSGGCFDGHNNFYVADSGNRRVQKFTALGEFLCMFGTETCSRDQKKEDICSVYVDRDNCVSVVGSGCTRIRTFCGDGRHVGDLRIEQTGCRSICFLFEGIDGGYAISDAANNRVMFYSRSSGEKLGEYPHACPSGGAFNAEGAFYLLGMDDHSLSLI